MEKGRETLPGSQRNTVLSEYLKLAFYFPWPHLLINKKNKNKKSRFKRLKNFHRTQAIIVWTVTGNIYKIKVTEIEGIRYLRNMDFEPERYLEV